MPDIKIKLGVEVQDAAAAVAAFVNETKEGIERAYTTSTEKAKQALDELIRKHQQVQETIDKDKAKIQELTVARETASKEARKAIDEEIEGMKRIVNGREIEKLKIDQKAIRLEEVGKLAAATSSEEKQGIEAATNARLANNQAIQDQLRAQGNVNDATDEGAKSVGNYFAQFIGIGTVITGFREMVELLNKQREQYEKTLSAAKGLQDLTIGQHDKFKQVFNEFGLNTQGEQDEAQNAINAVPVGQFNISQEISAGLAGRLGAAAKNAGLKATDPRFLSLVGNAGKYVNRGMDQEAVGDYLSSNLRKDKSYTGEQADQDLANLYEATGKSPRLASNLLQQFQQEQGAYEAAGFTFQDFEKVAVSMQGKVSPQEIPAVTRQFFNGMNRMGGLTDPQVVEEFQKLQQIDPIAARVLEAKKLTYRTPLDHLHAIMQARTGGITALDQSFEDRLKTGHFNEPQIAGIISNLPNDQQELAARQIAGPRDLPAFRAAAGFQNVQLPTNATPIPIPSSEADLAPLRREQAEAAGALANPAQASLETLRQQSAQFTQSVQEHPNDLTWQQRYLPSWVRGGGGSDEGMGVGGGLAQELVKIAQRIKQIDAGPSTSQSVAERARLQNSATAILGRLQGPDYNKDSDDADPGWKKFAALAYGSQQGVDGKTLTREQVLQGINNEKDVVDFTRKNLPYGMLPNDISNVDANLPLVTEAEQALRGQARTPTTRPATRPATQPTSINYHVRNYIYGYGLDTLGQPEQAPGNRYG